MSANKYPPYQDPALPGEPTPEDLAAFTQPVAEMDMSQLPTPVAATRPAKGLSFDWSALNAQTQEEYDAKPPALQHLIHEIKNTKGLQPTPEWAANRIIEIQRAIDEQNSPKAQADLQRIQAQTELANQNLQKAKTETLLTESELRDKYTAKKSAADSLGRVLGSIKKLKDNKDGRLWSTGGTSIFPAAPGSDAADFNAELDFLIKGATMQARDQLKGTGTITDKETDIAAGAEARLTRSQSEKVFLEGLNDLESFYQKKQEQLLSTPVERIPGITPQPAPQPAPLPQFQSRDQVMQAVNAGQITREQGVQALRAQFGNQFR